jgi:hypothetical protein
MTCGRRAEEDRLGACSYADIPQLQGLQEASPSAASTNPNRASTRAGAGLWGLLGLLGLFGLRGRRAPAEVVDMRRDETRRVA